MNREQVPVIIPSLEPDERLIILLENLQRKNISNIIIINDGSNKEYDDIFNTAKEKFGCTILKHYSNLGKGRALKNAFNYCLYTFPELVGCVTADSDGQHTAEDIVKCIDRLIENPDKLILGCRDFDQENVPIKSQLGNKITRNICKWLCDVKVTDTQTGLRGIPKDFMNYLLGIDGERFEFETNMLLETHNRIEIDEVLIQTVYDSKTDHVTHFDPVKDSIKIYKLFGRKFIRFLFSSLSSCIVDLLLFYILCNAFYGILDGYTILFSTICARCISAVYNYLINYKLVFDSNGRHIDLGTKYFGLAVVQMWLSGMLVTFFAQLLYSADKVIIKIFVDSFLFLISFLVQQKFVFRRNSSNHK